MTHRSTGRLTLPAAGGHERCHVVGPHTRAECVRDMDARIARAIRSGGLTRGAALALYGDVVETHPEDPCAARDHLEDVLDELTLA
jgi:hypothetical protein